MKVVLFCGGLGTRLREYSGEIPKPMVKIGYRPILWHVMKYYAHFGHKEFILCLGYKADVIKQFFLNYEEWISNDFTLSGGGKHLELENNDIADWHITFVDTGLHSNIGQRLVAVKKYVDADEMFLANYSDGLTDLHLPNMIDQFAKGDKIASFMAVPPSQSFHLVDMDPDGAVQAIRPVTESSILINGGYFVLRREIFDYIRPGEELVVEPFHRLINEGKLVAYRYDRFWVMDTFKEQQQLADMYNSGRGAWELWKVNGQEH
ncbi:MAG TPA: sugar phosphate nucleotidyltransferase [Ilumatobacteraceae bacterium]|jgi:glucose-1-phosphate cytidylyltransferase|nr:sugar phosphate nucleotidyltransferase [Ilumatobacteraceae bacterium]